MVLYFRVPSIPDLKTELDEQLAVFDSNNESNNESNNNSNNESNNESNNNSNNDSNNESNNNSNNDSNNISIDATNYIVKDNGITLVEQDGFINQINIEFEAQYTDGSIIDDVGEYIFIGSIQFTIINQPPNQARLSTTLSYNPLAAGSIGHIRRCNAKIQGIIRGLIKNAPVHVPPIAAIVPLGPPEDSENGLNGAVPKSPPHTAGGARKKKSKKSKKSKKAKKTKKTKKSRKIKRSIRL